MRYLYFQAKPPFGANKPRPSPSIRHLQTIQLLQNCSTKHQLLQIHAHMIRTHLIKDIFLASRIIAILTSPSISLIDYARKAFDQIPQPSIFTWNLMMRGYTHSHDPEDALLLFKRMFHRGFTPDSYTYTILASVCARRNCFWTGMSAHAMIIRHGFESDMFVMSGIINLYGGCGLINAARMVFDGMAEKDVVSWTTMLSGYAQFNRLDEAFILFDQMRAAGVEPNRVTITSIVSACGRLRALERGRWLHSLVLEFQMEDDVAVGNSLVNMYAKCGVMSSASEVFERMGMRDVVTWNSLINGFVQNGLHSEALALFQEMTRSRERPDGVTMASVLLACSQLGDLLRGKLLHAYIESHAIPLDVFVHNALINMYAKCGDLSKAETIFLQMIERDVYSWTVMISGYVQGSRCKEALALFEKMRHVSDVEANEVTLVNVLSACTQLGALAQGQQIHDYIDEHQLIQDICLGNALVDMYAKCGCIEIASRIFKEMPQKDIVSWNAMIGGFATNGHGREALSLFDQMQSLTDPKPDKLTLLAVLSACAHSGMITEGLCYFNTMSSLYDIVPVIEHYGCVVDLLGRAGLIDEANDFISKMPLSPNDVIWGSLLSACRIHRKMELGKRIARKIIKLAPEDEGVLVLISNLYAEADRWDDVRRMRVLMGSKGIEKSPGCSLIEVDGVVHEFFVGDRLIHHDPLYFVLEGLFIQSKQTYNESNNVLKSYDSPFLSYLSDYLSQSVIA